MREVLEGSQAVARTVARCRPGVVCAYPISPQTHIVEALSVMARTGELGACEYVNVESEFSAMSVAIGASAAGSRAYTATASQGLLYMAEAVFNAAGMGLPIVMTVANRAIGAPINIWNDHSDAMALRDSGWLQLYAADNQEAADLHVIAFAVAEELGIPAMVCMDGFVLTHATDVLELPDADAVDAFLPPYLPTQVLDVEYPITIGTMAGPESFTETKYLQHLRFLDAAEVIDGWSRRFLEAFGREAGGLVARYDRDTCERSRDASAARAGDVTVVAMGSVLGTLQAALPALHDAGVPVRLVGVSSFRPFPAAALRAALGASRDIVVIDRALELGSGGVLTGDVGRALAGTRSRIHSVVAGLGGRPILEASLQDVVRRALDGTLGALDFLDLKTGGIPVPTAGATEVHR
ncbi:pyruvate ferredoxin oxidoreductase [Demequina iriomotensis]|uniref:pyruvate ferredoxin oxidoreductase n=1 Tax=Demequina iriomotensis TaxID=1536641 RepID=UPI0007805350|nr:pyruvate ferredoxin oxidoreductase [Demequina iriomotensis]